MSIKRFEISPLLHTMREGGLILAPNHRIRDAILEAYEVNQKATVFQTPDVFAIDVWIKELWELAAEQAIAPFNQLQPLSAEEEHFVWAGIIERSLAEFPLLNPDDTAAIVAQSYRNLKQWVSDDTATKRLHEATAIADVAAFIGWLREYHQFCANHKLISLGDSTQLLIENFESVKNLVSHQSICLVDFFDPPPLYQKLFDEISTHLKLEFHNTDTGEKPRSEIRFEFSDQASEIDNCVRWTKESIAADPNDHIGIIINTNSRQKEQLKRKLKLELRENSRLDFNNTSTIFNSAASDKPLIEQAIVFDALLLLNLHQDTQSSEDLCRLLRSPYTIAYENEKESRIRMESLMRNRFSVVGSLATFSSLLAQIDKTHSCPQLAAALIGYRGRIRNYKREKPASQWAQEFTALLGELGWPGNANSKVEKKLLEQWQSTLETFAATQTTLGALTFSKALQKLRNMVSRMDTRLEYDPRCQLSVYSVAEASGLNFDKLWFLGFDDSSWPGITSPSPFLPYDLQREVGMPGSSSEADFERDRAAFDSIRNSVNGHTIASYHRLDGDMERRRSSLLNSFPDNNESIHFTAESKPALSSLHKTAVEEISDPAHFALLDGEEISGGSALLSNQSSCPFRAFANHRLHARELSEFESGLSNLSRGSAIHKAMETLFADMASQSALLELGEEQTRNVIDRATAAAISFLNTRFPLIMTPAFTKIETQRINGLIVQFLELEKQRSDFSIINNELELNWRYQSLNLNLKIDRVDQLGDGRFAIIDYKTGKTAPNKKDWLSERPLDLQLPFYYVVASEDGEREVSAVVIAHVNADKNAYSGIAAEANFHSSLEPVKDADKQAIDWQDLTGPWRGKIELIADEFISGKANVAPTQGLATCQYCKLAPLCRINELSQQLFDDSEGEMS